SADYQQRPPDYQPPPSADYQPPPSADYQPPGFEPPYLEQPPTSADYQQRPPDYQPPAYPPPPPSRFDQGSLPPVPPPAYGATGGPLAGSPTGPYGPTSSRDRTGLPIVLAAVVALVVAAFSYVAVELLTGDKADDVAVTGEQATEGPSESDDDSSAAGDTADADSSDRSAVDAEGNTDPSAATSAGDDFDCVVDAVDRSLLPPGVSSLEELYLAPVSGEAGRAYIEADFSCHPDPLGSNAFTESLGRNLELSTGDLIELDDGETRCLTQHLVDNTADPYQVLAVGDTAADVAAMRNAMESCFDEEDAAFIRRDVGSGPQNYGDDERLDALYDECTAGDERTCDLLWVATAEGSEYSEVAFDCAGRGATTTGLCTPDIELDLDGYADMTSPGAAELSDECRAGDATACDLLAAVAPPGSKSEELGYTCGGILPSTALPDCRTVMDE
ncbi:MAG: hypothetical protein OER95_19785, partial [Acidimicrobiia bacterium]|nr:hypothetical protein [Acidimicrobiia bacterium]